MATETLNIAAGVTSSGLIVGNDSVAAAQYLRVNVAGSAVDTVADNGAIVDVQNGGKAISTTIQGTVKAQEIVRAGGVADDTLVNNALGYQYVNGGTANRTVISNGSQWGNNNAKMYNTIVRGGYQIVGTAVTAYNTVVSGGSQLVTNGGTASRTVMLGGSALVSSGATVSDAVISGGRFSVWGGGTVDNITVVVGNGRNAVIRPEADGTIFTGNLTMDFSTAVAATTSANYFISSVSRVAANAGVSYTIKVAQDGQYSGEYCMGGGSTNITATVKTDTGLTLGSVSGGGSVNGAYLHTQFGSYRLYTNTYQYVGIVADPVAVFQGTTVVSRGTTVDTAVTVDSNREAYVRKGGTLKNLTVDAAADGKVVVYSGGVLDTAAVTGATAGNIAVSNGGVANNVTLAGAGAYLRLSGGTANDAVVSNGTLYLLAADAEAYRTTASAGFVDISAGRTESTTLRGTAREMVRNGATATGTIIDEGATGNQFVRAGGIASGTIVRGGSQQLYDANAKAYDTVVSGGEQQVYAGASAVRTVLSNGKIQNGGGSVSDARLFGAAANRLYVSNGGEATGTVLHDLAVTDVTGGTVISTILYDNTQELLRSNGVASGAVVSGGAQKVLSTGAVASGTVVYAGYQQVVAGASAWNTTIVAGNNGFVNLADGAVTGGTWNFDLSQDAPTATAMLNAWRITDGTDLVITVKTDDPWGGKYYLSSGASYFGNSTFTVKDTAGNVLASDFGNGSSVKVGDFTYKLALEGSGLYLSVSGYPVEIYTGTELTGYGTTVSGANVVAGMSAYVYDGGTLADARIVGAGGGKVLISSGGVASGTVVSGNVGFTDIRVYAGGVASDTTVAEYGMLRLSGGSGAGATVSGGQLLMYAGAVASGTVVGNEGTQKLLAPGAVAYDTVISSGGWMQVGATPEQTSGSYIAGGEAHNVIVRSGGAVRVYSSAAATGVSVDDGASAYVFSGGRIGFGTVASGAEVKVRFSEADGNDTALIADWGTFDAGAKLMLGEFGGVGTYALADSGNANLSSAYLEIGLTSRTAAVGEYFSDAFREWDFKLSADATTLTVSEFATPVAEQSAAAAFSAATATQLADGGFAAKWASGTTYSGNVNLGNASLGGNVWLTIDGFSNSSANLYGAEGDFAHDVNWRLRGGTIKNLAGGAKLGGKVGGVSILTEEGMKVLGAVYAGGMGDVDTERGISMLVDGGEFGGNVFAGALCNYVANGVATETGDISFVTSGGVFRSNLYGGAAVKAGAAAQVVHTAGDIKVKLDGGNAAKGTFCLYGGGYASGTAEDALVYTAGDVDITIGSGEWGKYQSGRGIFGGVYTDKVAASVGNVEITVGSTDKAVSAPTLGNIYGGGWSQNGGTSTVSGEVNITILGSAVINNVFGGGCYSSTSGGATSVGSVNISVEGGSIKNNIFAGGFGENSTVEGDISVSFAGSSNYSCNVFGYSSRTSAATVSDTVLTFAGYTGTLAGNVGGFDGIVFTGNTRATLSGSAIDNENWSFDYAGRTAGAAAAMLTLDNGSFDGDTVQVDLSAAVQSAGGWSIAAGLSGANADFSVELSNGMSAAGLNLNDTLDAGYGAYAGWGFALEDNTLKFKQLA